MDRIVVIALAFGGLLFSTSAWSEAGSDSYLAQTQALEYWWEPPGELLTAEQVATKPGWQRQENEALNFGRNERALWVRMPVYNAHGNTSEWIVKIDWPLLDDVRFQSVDPANGRWSVVQYAGEKLSISQRTQPFHVPVFRLNLPPDSHRFLYFRVQSHNALLVPIDFQSADQFTQWDRTNEMILGAFFGILLVMICYNACLFSTIRDVSYLYYCWYVGGILLYELVVTGAGSYYLWGEWDWFRHRSFGITASFAFLGASFFLRYFLSVKRYGGWVLHLNTFFVIYWSCALLLAFIPEPFMASLQDIMAMLSCFAGLGTTVYLWRKGNVSAKYFTIAWTFIIIATFHFAATVEGLMPRTGWTQYGQMIGFVLEVVLLSFALAERINRERAALHAAQHEALRMTENIAREREEKVNAQTAMIRLQQQHNDELECRVNQRTKELEHAMNELATANRELSRMSFTDGLTQVANRHYFDRILKEELYRSCCDQTPLTLLLVDIDFFKKINDQWGHLAGDECLRQVAVTLSAQTSLSRGLVARYGGEEFAVLLPGVDLDEGGLIAEQIRNQIECTEFQVKEDKVSLSVSIGIASQIAVEQENPEHLIGVADTALYQAKRAGRNRAVLAQAG